VKNTSSRNVKIVERRPNVLCYKCKRKGVHEVYEVNDRRFDRMIHADNVCDLGESWGSYEEVLQRFSDRPRRSSSHSLDEYEALVSDMTRTSKLLDDARYKIIRQNVLNKLFKKDLFAMLNKSKTEQERMRSYEAIVANFVSVVEELHTKTYAGSGKSLQREFTKVLKNAGFWNGKELKLSD
jgi:hypothetical protein